MYNENNRQKAKEEWKKNENRVRIRLFLLLLAVIMLVVFLLFYNSFIWIILTDIAVVVGLVADIVVLRKEMGNQK